MFTGDGGGGVWSMVTGGCGRYVRVWSRKGQPGRVWCTGG